MALLNGMVRCGMEILKLLKANIKHKKGAFKSIAALMAIIVLSFTGTVSNNDNIDRTLTEAHIWSGTADMTAFLAAPYFDGEITAAINGSSDVAEMKTAKCILSNGERLNGQEMYQGSYIYPESSTIYRVFSESATGYVENPEPLKEGEIYIAYSLKGLYDGVKIGSEISFDIPSEDPSVMNTYNFKIKGFIADPHFGAAIIGTKRYFVSDADFEKMYANAGEWFTCVEADINLREGADYAQVKKVLDDSCGLAEKADFVISDTETISYTKLYSDAGSGVVYAFVILLIVIAVITMYHSITTSIEMEYVNLGVLKSQGFTTGKIRLVYVLQYIFAELIGAVIGLILSVPVLILFGTVFQSITGLVTIHNVSFLKCGLLSIGIIAVSVAFVALATARVSRISPVCAISGGKSEVHFDSRLNVPVKGKPLSFFMGLRQFTSRGKSYTGVILIAALLVYFMMSIVVLSDRLSGGKIITGQVHPNVIVVPSEEFQITDMDKFEETVLEIDENANVIFNKTVYIMADGVEFLCDAATPVEHLYKPLDGRMPLYNNEIAITHIMSEELNKKIGDTIILGSGESAKEFIVTGYYQSLSDLGRTFTITAEGLYEVTGEFAICYIELSDESLAEAVSEALDEQHGSLIGVKGIEDDPYSAADDGMIALIDSICLILVIVVFSISIIFSAVVINMICSKSFVKERTDIGILKALGFTADGLRIQFAFRFMIIAAIGSVIGGIASFFFTSPLLETLMKIVGLTQIEADITPITFIIPAAAICASFFLFAYIAAKKIRSVEVRELISE